jgi:hypothetical protein
MVPRGQGSPWNLKQQQKGSAGPGGWTRALERNAPQDTWLTARGPDCSYGRPPPHKKR